MTQRWTLSVSRWATVGGEGSIAPAQVDASLRRRLSSLARLSLVAMQECLGDRAQVRVVYASRHGEMARTTSMLEGLAQGLEPSPTAFSMSVLNATVGVDSISRMNRQPATAVSAGASTLGMALLEAGLQHAAEPSTPVLLIYADEPLPALYEPGRVAEFQDVQAPVAVALLLDNEGPRQIRCEVEISRKAHTKQSQVAAFLQFMDTGNTGVWHDGARQWTWEAGEE